MYINYFRTPLTVHVSRGQIIIWIQHCTQWKCNKAMKFSTNINGPAEKMMFSIGYMYLHVHFLLELLLIYIAVLGY